MTDTPTAISNPSIHAKNNDSNARRLIILGSTGSIGVNALDVVQNLTPSPTVVGLAAGSNVELLAKQAKAFNVKHLAISDPDAAPALAAACPAASIYSGSDAAQQLTAAVEADICLSAIVGAAGLPPTLTAIQKSTHIALANKETLVAAGELVMPLVKKQGIDLLPVDSEHSAIFQCLPPHDLQKHARIHDSTDRSNTSISLDSATESHRSIKKIILTASGGPFRNSTREQIRNATVQQALNHPTWEMGPKITIDSATMMNKALEIIEAHWLFDLSAKQIDVIIHPQSIAHSFVEFTDNSILAQLGTPDMRTPIQYALTYPARARGCSEPLDWSTLSQLDFQPPDFDRFPALKLAYRVIETGGTSGAILNAANEQAVAAFLEEKIPFGRIVDLAEDALNNLDITPVRDLQTIHDADVQAREFVSNQINS